MRGDSGLAGEGRVAGILKFHSWGKCSMPLTKHQLRLDVQRFLWPVYYLYYTSKVTALQDAYRRLVLQVYLGSNTIEFSAIHR